MEWESDPDVAVMTTVEVPRGVPLVMPLLPLAHAGGLSTARGVNTGPFGETIAGDFRPRVRASQS